MVDKLAESNREMLQEALAQLKGAKKRERVHKKVRYLLLLSCKIAKSVLREFLVGQHRLDWSDDYSQESQEVDRFSHEGCQKDLQKGHFQVVANECRRTGRNSKNRQQLAQRHQGWID